MDEANYCKVCLIQTHPTSQCPHISNLACPHLQPKFTQQTKQMHEQRTAQKTPATKSVLQVAKWKSREPKNSLNWTVWQSGVPQTGTRRSLWTLVETSCRNQEGPDWTSPKTLGVEDPAVASSPLNCLSPTGDTSMDDHLDVPEPEVETVLLADVKSAEELDFDATDVIASFRNANYKVNMCVCVLITSNIL